jgi:hypothetical protein
MNFFQHGELKKRGCGNRRKMASELWETHQSLKFETPNLGGT